MPKNYQVNYTINVSAPNAQQTIAAFQRQIQSLTQLVTPINTLERSLYNVQWIAEYLSRERFVININTRAAVRNVDRLRGKLQQLLQVMQQATAAGMNISGGRRATRSSMRTPRPVTSPSGGSSSGGSTSGGSTSGGGTSSGGTSSGGSSSGGSTSGGSTKAKSVKGAKVWTQPQKMFPTNPWYKLFGPTPLPNNGGMAIDMLKGMGIAYGLSGMGTLVSNIVQQSAEFDNTMKTVENILKSHDDKSDFSGRFSAMSQTIRQVGMETKYKVTEVADAAKFLAMAGLEVDAISTAIRPIADIALIGDTELGQTADMVTNIMTAYNLRPEQMRTAADVMTNTFTMANTTLTEMAESYKYSASLLAAGNVSFEESAAAIGVLGDAGIKGSQAGTTLRTIMANLVNPTKKQKAAWDAIGISLKDKNGNNRDIIDIFRELNAKNLDVSAFYRLFHKTAASGATALADHVDKWQKIQIENYLSHGLSSELADAKKNTIQGLWAQLTSVFTDQGVTAFGSVQGVIRDMMKKAIAYLKTEDFAKKLKEISKAIMELLRIFIQATKWFAMFYEGVGGLIKEWLKFQLMVWPVVKAFQALSTVVQMIFSIRQIIPAIRAWAAGFGAVANNAGQAANAIQAANNAQSGIAPAAQGGRLMRGIKGLGRTGLGVGATVMAMHEFTREDARGQDAAAGTLYALSAPLMMTGGHAGMIAGGVAALGGGGLQIWGSRARFDDFQRLMEERMNNMRILEGVRQEEQSTAEKYLEFTWRCQYNINELLERRIELYSKLAGLDIPNTSSDNGFGTDEFRKQIDAYDKANTVFKGAETKGGVAVDDINSLFRDVGVEAPVYSDGDGNFFFKNPYTQKTIHLGGYKDIQAQAAAVEQAYASSYVKSVQDEGQKKLAAFMLNPSTTVEDLINFRDAYLKKYIQDPRDAARDVYTENDRVRLMTGDATEIFKSPVAQLISEKLLKNVIDNINYAIQYRGKIANNQPVTLAEVTRYLRRSAFSETTNFWDDYNPNDLAGFYARHGLNIKEGKWEDPEHLNTPETMARLESVAAAQAIEELRKNTLIPEDQKNGLIEVAEMLVKLADIASGSEKELRGSRIGEIKKMRDGNNYRWDGTNWELLDADGKVKQFTEIVEDLSGAMTSLETRVNGLLNGEFPVISPVYSTQGFGQLGVNIPGVAGWWNQHIEDNGGGATNYRLRTGAGVNPASTWRPPAGVNSTGGVTYNTPLFNWHAPMLKQGASRSILTPAAAAALQNGKSDKSLIGNRDGGGSDNNSGGSDKDGSHSSDYSSKYRNHAAPKQININIQNLMNVDKIDLSDPKKAAIIQSLKQDIAYALYEAAADGTMMLNGLTT